jgi:hypothetical protein
VVHDFVLEKMWMSEELLGLLGLLELLGLELLEKRLSVKQIG